MNHKPHAREVKEAMRVPGGYVYRIAGKFADNSAVPPEAIIGAWKVNNLGVIVGEFIQNKKYNPQMR